MKTKKLLKSTSKKLKKSYLKSKRKFNICIGITFLLLFSFGMYMYLRPKPNDDIYFQKSSSNSILGNRNPSFKVDFGKRDDPESQWVRFEARASSNNPFEDIEGGFFTKLFNMISPKKEYGIEMSLEGVKLGETQELDIGEKSDEVKTVADIIGTDSVKTSTELIESGRVIGEYIEEPVSKKTVLNKNVANGVDIEYQILEGLGLKEEIVIRDLGEYTKECGDNLFECSIPLNEFIFDLRLDKGLELKRGWHTIKGVSTETFYFVDSRGNYVAHFLPNWAVDSVGDKTYDVISDIESRGEGNYKIKVVVDINWLFSSDRVYPIRVDPSIVHDSKSKFDEGIFDRTESFDGARVEIKGGSGNTYGIYTSSNIDLQSETDITSISWVDSGNNTGDGETPYSTTGLVAQWNLNETSGTTAVSGGSCGTSCNGTLTNFASTGSQDAAPMSGWTYDNRRWGAGALMFDGTNDYVDVSSFEFNENGVFSAELWFNPRESSSSQYLLDFRSADTAGQAATIEYNGSSKLISYGVYGTTFISSTNIINANTWNHIVISHDSNNDTFSIYINGELDSTNAITQDLTLSSLPLRIGARRVTNTVPFSGVLDSVRVYSRALSSSEILSNYQAGNIEFQYRVGSGTSNVIGYYKNITIDPNYIDATITDLPVLVSTTDTDLKDTSNGGNVYQSDGGDIKFTDSTGTTKYDHEIEKYDPSTGELIAWIKIPSVSSTTDTIFRMYYGSDTPGDQWNPSGVWSADYEGVWHMSEVSVGSSAVTRNDSSSNGNNLTDMNTTASGTGKVGVGADFERSNSEYLRITHANQTGLDLIGTSYTISFWFKPESRNTDHGYISKGNWNNSSYMYGVDHNWYGYRGWYSNDWSSTAYDVESTTQVTVDTWAHIVFIHDTENNEDRIYVDGVLETTETSRTVDMTGSDADFWIGRWHYYADGIMDEVRVASATKSSAYISASYDNQNTPNDFLSIGTENEVTEISGFVWSDWTGGVEESIEGFNNDYLYSSDDSNLIVYLPMDEENDDTCSGGEDACNIKSSSHHGTSTGTSIVEGVFGKARGFINTTDQLSINDHTDLKPSVFSAEAWVKTRDVALRFIYHKYNVASPFQGHGMAIRAAGTVGCWVGGSAWTESTTVVADGHWHHVACTYDGTNTRVYVDGKLETTLAQTANLSYATNMLIGKFSGGTTMTFRGSIDEFKFYNRTKTTEEIYNDWFWGSSNAYTINGKKSGVVKVDGNSLRLDKSLKPDGVTMSMWNFDEVGGTGAFLKDSSGRGGHLTPTNTTYVKGYNGGARAFNGTNSYAQAPGSAYVNVAGDITVEAWIYPTSWSAVSNLVHKDSQYSISINTSGHVAWADSSNWSFASFGYQNIGLQQNQWQYLTVTKSGTTVTIYLNGVQKMSKTFGSAITTTTNNFHVGCYANATACTGYYYAGYIDDLQISDVARPYNEIAEKYRLGRDHYLNKSITNTDLTTKTKIPFWIASDQLGLNTNIVYGENGYGNYTSDYNTVGFWKMDEENGSGAYIRDYSGRGNNGTPVSTTSSTGYIGKSLSFNGTSSAVTLPASADFDLQNLTIDSWVYSDNFNRNMFIFEKTTNGSVNTQYSCFFNATDTIYFRTYNSSGTADDLTVTTSSFVSNNAWNHVACVYNGTTKAIYVNGILAGSKSYTQTLRTNPAGTSFIGRHAGSSYYFNGKIDEIRVSNVARTPAEIRQAYEIGLRTHPVNVLFKADLQSSNLIADSDDLSFTISETAYGTTDDIENINIEDKIIIKENYNGIEYIAQGTVETRNKDTGAITVTSWDTGSTFPSVGYSVNATVFKWQREYVDIRGILPELRDDISLLTFRFPNSTPANFWIDDFKTAKYATLADLASGIPGTTRYFQYRTIFTTYDANVTPNISSVQIDYGSTGPTMEQIMRHGKWFNSGQKQPYWWVGQ